MKSVTRRPIRMALALGLVVVIASMLAVLGASGSFAAGPQPTLTVTCPPAGEVAVFSWSGATGIGYLQISTSGADTITLTTSQKSGTFSVHNSFTQGVTAGAQLRSTLDKSGNSAVLASAETPAGGC